MALRNTSATLSGYGLVEPRGREPRPPSRTSSYARLIADPLGRAGDKYFSAAASTEQRLGYLAALLLFGLVSCIVLLSDLLTPPCDESLVDAIFPLHDKPFINPHYNPGCASVRYLALLGLTPRECDLGRRILFAISCGGAVGYERRRGDRPAGIRTMALVSLGSCIFTITSILAFEDGPMSWDSSRVAAAIPSGVGFLGAGLIWRSSIRSEGGDTHQQIHGLTTAASTWVSASIGVAAGGAMYFVASFSVLTLLFVLRFGPRASDAPTASSSDADLAELGRRLEAPAPAPPGDTATYHS